MAMEDHYSQSFARSRFLEETSTFCQNSTLHGIGELYRADNKTVRIFWIVIIIGAFGASIYGCYAILDQYMEAPVIASYIVTQPSQPTLRIPDVIICPFNRFDNNFFTTHNITREMAIYVEFAFGLLKKHPVQEAAVYSTFAQMMQNKTNLAADFDNLLKRMNVTFRQFLNLASLPCEEVIVACGSQKGADCCKASETLMSSFGRCFRIKGLNQSGSGFPFALSLAVKLPKHRYHPAPNNIPADGIAVKFAEPGRGIDFDLYYIPATRYEFINDPPRYECWNDKEDDHSYNHLACLDHCLWQKNEQECNCSHPATTFTYSNATCTTIQVLDCLFAPRFFPNLSFVEALMANCQRRCKPRCVFWQYTAVPSYAKFPSDIMRQFVDSLDEWSQMQNTIILDVYYERFEYTLIRHHAAMTSHSFIANLGGQYSLWLGGSILTLIQFLVFLWRYILHVCRRLYFRRKMVIVSKKRKKRKNATICNGNNLNHPRRKEKGLANDWPAEREDSDNTTYL